ncbi:MAG: single-stranded DNA-binding protein [Candidatus Riflebacteria bacterium]|nr:single-stranded DNA-binding protein [Candidatus Riflebacteria bacterium]
MNKVYIDGRLAQDPEAKYTPNSKAVTTFNIANSENVLKPDGTWATSTTFYKVVTWNKLAEYCAKHLKKGDSVFIEGKIYKRPYEVKGNKYIDSGITAEKVVFVTPISKGLPKSAKDEPQQPDLVIDMADTEAVNKIFKDDETIPF